MLAIIAVLAGWPLAQVEGPPAPVETWRDAAGTRVSGRVLGDAASGFRFQPEAGGPALPLEKTVAVTFESPEVASVPKGLPPFHALLGLEQRISGRLGTVSARVIQLEDGPNGAAVTLPRGGVTALLQRPGEAQVFQDGFEAIDESRWRQVGEPEVAANPHLSGQRALRLPAGGSSVTYRLAEPMVAGRLELAYCDSGAQAEDQHWFVDLTFQGPNGPEPVRAILGWNEETLAVESSPGGPSLVVQRLVRKPGWHQLVIRFGPERTELAVDGDALAHGDGPGGPLTEIRLASETRGKAGPPAGLAGAIDDFRLVRLAEPIGGLEVEPTQDEVRLLSGDQVFGYIRSADSEHVVLSVAGKDVDFPWSEVAGLYFRRTPATGTPIEGLLVRLEWRAAPGHDPRDLDQAEGALIAVSDAAFTLATPYAGTLTIPRDRLRKLHVLGKARRLVLDPHAHHLGNEVFKELHFDPPQPEGRTLEIAFDLDAVPPGAATLALDVVQVAGEADHLPFAELIAQGELRTNIALNGQPLDYINRYIMSKNETPERIRIPIPAGRLRGGRNTLTFTQAGRKNDPNYLDDLGLLCIALEFEPSLSARKLGP
jgi:hypothetical protein